MFLDSDVKEIFENIEFSNVISKPAQIYKAFGKECFVKKRT